MTPKRPLRTPTFPPRPDVESTLVVTPRAAAAGDCGVYKVWAQDERLTSPDLNDSFQRTADANTPQCVAGYSETLGQMRQTTAPYPTGAESQATTLAGELERIRFQLAALVGKTHWYDAVDGGTAKGSTKDFGAAAIQMHEIALPAAPPADELRLFAIDDGGGQTILAYRTANGSVVSLTGPQTHYGNSVTQYLTIQSNPGAPEQPRIDVAWDALSINGYVSPPASYTIDLTTTGVNALDAGVLQPDLFYYVWAIYNPAQNLFRCLASFSETAPTMPAGYTAKRVLGGMRTSPGALLLEGKQVDDTFLYKKPLLLASDARQNSATPVSLLSLVPVIATKEVFLGVQQLAGFACTVLSPFAFSSGVTVENATSLGPVIPFATVIPNAPIGTLWLPLVGPSRGVFYFASNNDGDGVPFPISIYVHGFKVAWRATP
jgi:hypothetical protein